MPNRNNREMGKTGQTWEDGEGGGRQSESARHERRMESARGPVHLTSSRAQSRFCFFCVPTIHSVALLDDLQRIMMRLYKITHSLLCMYTTFLYYLM